MKNVVLTTVLIASLGLMAGCPSKKPDQPPPPPQQTTSDTSGVGDAGATVDDTATGGPTGELLLPVIADVIRSVDLEAHRLTVHLLEGLR